MFRSGALPSKQRRDAESDMSEEVTDSRRTGARKCAPGTEFQRRVGFNT